MLKGIALKGVRPPTTRAEDLGGDTEVEDREAPAVTVTSDPSRVLAFFVVGPYISVRAIWRFTPVAFSVAI